ncbi:DEAD/DEAH box helicase [Robertmurraya andreesenii]|uniref:Superfamily II DNA or RNA helicase n=1 Tax=Anoxybacillus andreesenii TaxID=1325932 RepID=A0ABT9V6E8_9BACL|nr:helicase-related protein [Robertmurraya andreesenii]MDQ0156520.1 superfamily II DNA or RNA helicase [Robertmurraya andreesenii]
MLKSGEIIKGPFWPEIVEIKNCELIDDGLYQVESIGRNTNKYYDRYLEQYQLEQLEKIQQEDSYFNPDRLQHYLQYYILKTEEKYSQSRAKGNKKIIPLPHQIEAVYSRMLQSPQVRYLLADDPGAGKTIMSGMLIRELLARQSAERILILVPPLVLKQWQEELKEKFGEDFTIVTRSLLNNSNEINPFEAYDKVIASVYWASREEIKSLILKSQFDLVIVDEAHKMAAYTHGVKKKKIQRTKMYQLGEALLRHTEHCLLLTATPHKGDKENYRHLMSLVDHDIFSRLNSGESMYEKSNPFVIRRLKESMVNFDGTPLFPKRTTKTISFELSAEEQELYEEVTEYVREHFNRAKQNNKPNVAFAMMILQRRLSSSLDAIYLSLVRRKEKLEAVLYNQQHMQQVDTEDFEDLSADEQEELEMQLEGETETLNLEELQLEIDVLGRLVEKANWIRQQDVERKYIELEQTLFGGNGLLAKGEKILIFTESKDTLYYLEKKLLTHVPEVAKIVGNFSMDQRRMEVEKFRNELQIMLATDAGGESINLQFCNQMINYDIPWNPNRLEQRMGRIHRIGQKNEVFIFNLVASNTREGDVLVRLLEKMEQMRNDLGQELVYDFIGDVLKEQGVDLSDLMEQAVSGRENLDELIARMEKTLSEEHKRLLDLAKQERMDEQSFDLPGMRRAYQELSINSLPARVYGEFAVAQFEETRIRLHLSTDGTLGRIDRFPKNIRELAKKRRIPLKTDESIRFALKPQKETEETPLLQNDHPLYKLALELGGTEIQQVAIPVCHVEANVSEQITVELDQVSIVDGTGRELERSFMLLGKRESGEWIQIDPYCLFTKPFDVINTDGGEDPSFKREAIMQARRLLQGVQMKRDDYVNKKSVYLRKSFDEQMITLQNRLLQYEQSNIDNKNSALINLTYSQIEDLEERSRERLDDIERERSIQLQPIKRIAQLILEPTEQTGRVIPDDVFQKVKEYEYQNGRLNIQKRKAFGLVDFTSEGTKDETRFIIVTDSLPDLLRSINYDDYTGIEQYVYIYVIESNDISEEVSLDKTLRLL